MPNIGLPLQPRIEKNVHDVESHWLFGKVPGSAASKEGHGVSLLRH